jgi:superfamily I DNA/RNA helicase
MKTVIICRTNAPLVKCLFAFIKKGRRIKARIVGREISKALKDVIGEVLDYRRNASITEFQVLLDSWINGLRTKYKDAEGSEDFLAEQEDYYACLTEFSKEADTARGLYDVIDTYIIDEEQLENEDEYTIVLSSAHRAKGLEWDRVVILRADLMPHPNAETEDELRQEEHIRYVALTRARKVLWVCYDDKPD